MAKIGTAHVEVKPVLNEDALTALGTRIEATVRDAVQRGLGEGGETDDPMLTFATTLRELRKRVERLS